MSTYYFDFPLASSLILSTICATDVLDSVHIPPARCYRKNEYDGVQEYWIVWRERGSHEEMKEVTEKQRSRQEATINHMGLQWLASASSRLYILY